MSRKIIIALICICAICIIASAALIIDSIRQNPDPAEQEYIESMEENADEANPESTDKSAEEAAGKIIPEVSGEDFETDDDEKEDSGNNDYNVYDYSAPETVLADNIVMDGALGSDEYPLLSAFGPRDNMGTAISTYHRGMDFGMDLYTVLCAPVNTVIAYVGENDTRGKWLVMYLGNGIYLEYQHLYDIYVSRGAFVKAHTPVCKSGETGVSIMPHLHLEILISPNSIDDITDFEDLDLRVDPESYLSMNVSEFNYRKGLYY